MGLYAVHNKHAVYTTQAACLEKPLGIGDGCCRRLRVYKPEQTTGHPEQCYKWAYKVVVEHVAVVCMQTSTGTGATYELASS